MHCKYQTSSKTQKKQLNLNPLFCCHVQYWWHQKRVLLQQILQVVMQQGRPFSPLCPLGPQLAPDATWRHDDMTLPRNLLWKCLRYSVIQPKYGYGSIPINTIFRGMNIHLPAILMFTRGTRFWHTAISQMSKSELKPTKVFQFLFFSKNVVPVLPALNPGARPKARLRSCHWCHTMHLACVLWDACGSKQGQNRTQVDIKLEKTGKCIQKTAQTNVHHPQCHNAS